MVDCHRSPIAAQYLQAFFRSRLADHPASGTDGMVKVLNAAFAITA
ncbi:hypothetical protein G3I24_08665 [Micromonospora aurantiaca]|nr:hypothetical protein [Micromonospora aurantiaca]